MSGCFRAKMDILPPAQRSLWSQLGKTPKLGFVLYGGTAIALRIGHRPSVDFDFFSEEPLNREAIRATFPFLSQATVLQDERNTWCLLVPCGDASHNTVKLAFYGNIGFGRVGQPEFTADGVLEVASMDDLMATKLKVIPQRAEVKDYRDIAAMLRSGANLPHGLAAARAIFGLNFQPSESLKALVYFGDGDLPTLSKDEKSTLVKAASRVRDLPVVEILSNRLSASPPP